MPLSPELRALFRDAPSAPPTRPQVGLEPRFEPSDGVQVRPGGPVEDRGDGRVVDARVRFGGAEAPLAERGPEVEGKEAGGFNRGLVTRNVGPVDRNFRGELSGRSGHDDSVGPLRLSAVATGPEPTALLDVRYTDTVDRNQQRKPNIRVEDGNISGVIDNYVPTLPPAHWEEIGDFVRAAVTDCDLKTKYTARELIRVAAYHVHWCWQTAGIPLERDTIFSRELISEFIERGNTHSQSYRGNDRSKLLRMSELLLGPSNRTKRLKPLPKDSLAHPYTEEEVILLRAWANSQNTQHRTVNAHMLLALSLGAGLNGGEVMNARCKHVVVDEQGVLVTVAHRRPRTIPVLAEWESIIATVAKAAMDPNMYLFLPNTRRPSGSALNNFTTHRTIQGQVHASTPRMRATWLVRHISSGTPPKALVEAAGVEGLDALGRYVPFAYPISWDETRRAFRKPGYRWGDGE